MKTEYEIAKRLHFAEENEAGRMSRPAVKVAIGGIALGVAVMIVTLGVVFGFKETVREKVIGFGGHIQVVSFDNNSTYEMQPIPVSDSLLHELCIIPCVTSATPFCTKPGIIKTEDAFQGIVLRGEPLCDSKETGKQLDNSKEAGKQQCDSKEADEQKCDSKEAGEQKCDSKEAGEQKCDSKEAGKQQCDSKEADEQKCDSKEAGEQQCGRKEGSESLYNNKEARKFFQANMAEGRMPETPQEVIVSKMLCQQLGLALDSSFFCYFVEDEVRVRKFRICGVYDTQFADYDKLFVIGDISVIRQLNGWDTSQASGIEVRIDDFGHLEEVTDAVYFATANKMNEDEHAYYTQNIEELNPTIFSWLALLDMNVVVILLLMLAVSAMNIISGLIILILNSIQMIGTLKALGATNMFIRKIFLTEAGFLIAKGMLWGNVLGLGLCALQYWFRLVPLEAASYYVSYVPIAWHWGAIVLLNIGTLALTLLILLLPSGIVSHISPAKVMRYE